MNRHNMRVIKLGRGLRFAQRPAVNVYGILYDFDRYGTPHPRVMGQVYGGIRPSTQPSDQPVTIEQKRSLNHLVN